MTVKSILAPAVVLVSLGFGAGFIPASPALAQALRVQSGSVRETLAVAMNRAVVVESDIPFVELSIANPGIADISTLSKPG